VNDLQRTGRILKWATLGAAATLMLLVFALLTLDLGFMRATVEERLSQALGRQLTINEAIYIELGRTTTLEARGVRLANPEWAGPGAFLEIDRLYVALETASLWQERPPTINRLDVDGVRLNLVEDEEGRGNWKFDVPERSAQTSPTTLPFLLSDARLDQIEIELQSPRLVKPLDVRLDHLVQHLDDDGTVKIEIAGEVKGNAISFQGSVGHWSRLLAAKNIRIEGSGGLGIGTFSVEAEMDDLLSPRRPAIRVSAESPSLEHLTRALNLGDFGDGAVRLQATTQPGGDHVLARLEASVGPLTIDFSSRMTTLQDFEEISIRGSASGQSLGGLARLAGYPGWPEAPFTLGIDTERNTGGVTVRELNFDVAEARLLLEGRIPAFPSMVGADVSLDLSGKDLAAFSEPVGAGPLPAGAFSIKGKVNAAAARRTELDLSFSTSPLTGRLQGVLEDEFNYELRLAAGGDDLAALERLQGLGKLPPGPFQLDGAANADQEGTRFSAKFSAPPGEGEANGFLHRDDRLGLDLNMSGAFASRLGDLLGLSGLPDTPWTLSLDLDQPSQRFYDIRRLRFATDGAVLDVSGRLGAVSASQDTRITLSASGPDMSRLQGLAPESMTFFKAPFDIRGEVASGDGVWLLSDVRAEVGPTRLELEGRLGGHESLSGTDLRLALEGRELGALIDPPGAARLPEGPFSSRARFQIEDGDAVVEGFELNAGTLKLRADVRVPWPLGPDHGAFNIQGRGENITRLLPELGGLDLEALSFSVEGSGQWSDEALEVDALKIALGDAGLELAGVLDLPPDASATDMTLKVHAPNLSRIATLGGTIYGELPFKLETRLSGSATHMELAQLSARLGQSDIKGLFKLDVQGEKPLFDLRLTTNSLNLRPFLTGNTDAATPKTDARADDRVIPEVPIPFDKLALADGQFVIAADELVLRRSALYDNLIGGRVVDGALRINEIGTDMTGGRLNIGLDIVPADQPNGQIQLSIHSQNLIFDFSDTPREQKLQQPAIDIDMELEAYGSTARELAASLEGDFLISSPGGKFFNSDNQDHVRPILVEIINALAPATSRQAEIEISCLALIGRAESGVVQLDPGMALQSRRTNTVAIGSIDLNQESLDLNIKSKTRRMVDLSAGELVSPFVKVRGTLAKPAITIDPKGTLITGGAAILSGGLTLLADKAIGQFSGENPCEDFLAEASESPPPQ
jgi:hypothetical protein